MSPPAEVTGRPVRIGVIGCGSVLDQYMAAARTLPATVVLACGRPHQQGRVQGTWQVPRFVTDERAVLEADDVDLVLVLTPPGDHARLARAALAAGKHVLCEKPLATSREEAAALLAEARNARGHLLAAPFTVLSPTHRAIAARLARGEIGRVVSARGRYGWAGPWWSDWFYGPEGGAVRDLGVYNLTSLTGWLGPVRRVTAMAGVAIPEREVNGRRVRVQAEDNAHVLLEHAGGALSAITTGFTMQQYRSPALELYGTDGTIQLLGDDWHPDGHEVWRRGVGAWQVYKASGWSWTAGLDHLVTCIAEGTEPLLSPEHAFHVLDVVTAVHISAREGRAVPVESTFPALALTEDTGGFPAHLMHDRGRRSEA